MYYLIVVQRDGEWVDEGYSAVESDKYTELKVYEEIFGTGNVRLVSKKDWEAENINCEGNLKAYRHLKEKQDVEYQACLKKDADSEDKVCKKEESTAEKASSTVDHPVKHPTPESLELPPSEPRPTTLEELRRRRLAHFDFTERRMTRSSAKKLGKSSFKKV